MSALAEQTILLKCLIVNTLLEDVCAGGADMVKEVVDI